MLPWYADANFDVSQTNTVIDQ